MSFHHLKIWNINAVYTAGKVVIFSTAFQSYSRWGSQSKKQKWYQPGFAHLRERNIHFFPPYKCSYFGVFIICKLSHAAYVTETRKGIVHTREPSVSLQQPALHVTITSNIRPSKYLLSVAMTGWENINTAVETLRLVLMTCRETKL